MGRGRCSFKQVDVTRALKAAAASGMRWERVEIDKSGKIIVVTAPLRQPAEHNDKDELDQPGG